MKTQNEDIYDLITMYPLATSDSLRSNLTNEILRGDNSLTEFNVKTRNLCIYFHRNMFITKFNEILDFLQNFKKYTFQFK